MPRYHMLQVDAFTTEPLAGNPCAIVLDADDMDERTMQRVAREMNLSETSFVFTSDVADFGVRYFTPAEEVPLAGHPTIATGWALAETGRIPVEGSGSTVTFELRVGPIEVELQAEDGELRRVVMTQKKPEFLRIYEPPEVLPVFGIPEDGRMEGQVIQTVSTGTPQLMVPVRSHEVLRGLRVDVEALNDLRQAGDFFSAHVFTLGGVGDDGDTFARHFAGPPDLFEDPFTGSATGGMSAYLWRYGLLDRPRFTAEQGHWMGRPGRASVEVVGPREEIQTVRVGGPAVTVLEGELGI